MNGRFDEPENIWCLPDEWQEWLKGVLKDARALEERVAELQKAEKPE